MELNKRCLDCKFLCKMLAEEDASKCNKYEETVRKDKGETHRNPLKGHGPVVIKKRR